LLRARDRHCRFPGCRQPAIRCEIDHTHAASDGGLTHVRNLAHLCKRHHDVKHHTRWRVRQLTGGLLVWTSPTGRVYREDAPPPVVAFAPAIDPPPRTSPPRTSPPRTSPPFGDPPPF
ncbi:HNH endonuclease signature motif containing protein, partial [Microbacterium thalli]